MLRPLSILSATTLLYSCAGPMSPFGSRTLDIINPSSLITFFLKNEGRNNSREIASLKNTGKVEISFFPKRQNWHQEHDLYVILESTGIDLHAHNLKVHWDNHDVSQSFNWMKEIIHQENNLMVIRLNDIRLIPGRLNKIKAHYISPNDTRVFKREYKAPNCNITQTHPIKNTKPFKVKNSFLQIVEDYSQRNSINPAFMTALIAQESGFDTKAVSHAKAIGLTQVTELANIHVTRKHRNWKSDRRIKKLPVPVIRALIKMGKINSTHDWRLNKRKSVLGGIEYIKYLNRYWNGNLGLIERVFGTNINLDEIKSELIIASYNSGPYRIKTQLLSQGEKWKYSSNIKEARKYLGKVKSYCYHFSKNKEALYENKAINF